MLLKLKCDQIQTIRNHLVVGNNKKKKKTYEYMFTVNHAGGGKTACIQKPTNQHVIPTNQTVTTVVYKGRRHSTI